MINAMKAYFESKNGAIVKEIESKIENEINQAIERGDYSCVVCPYRQMTQEIKDKIIEDLIELGYEIEIDDNDKKYGNAPSDQRPWYDDIHISWKNAMMG